MKEYYSIGVLKDIFLEDSYVLEIIEQLDKIVFKMDFVLCESHPFYKVPKNNERYCYHLGEIVFSKLEKISWIEKNTKNYSYDENNEKDLGNIDCFNYDSNTYNLEGDWGELHIKCNTIQVILY